MDVKATINVIGDYGNPAGTGLAQMKFNGLPYSANEVTDAQTACQAFQAALITAQLTSTVIGDIGVTVLSENLNSKPGADVNIDRRCEYTWRTKQDSSIRRGTVHGVPATSTGVDKLPQGERLNDVGKAALAAALAAFYEIVLPDEVIVLQGKVLQKA